MSIAINEDHVALADTVAAFPDPARLADRGPGLPRRRPRGPPRLLGRAGGLGWLGLHLGEDVGGSGFELEELVVVAEQTGRALMPGPFLPTVIASAAVQSAGTDEQRPACCPAWPTARSPPVALDGDVTVADGKASASCAPRSGRDRRPAAGPGRKRRRRRDAAATPVRPPIRSPACRSRCPTTSTPAAAPAGHPGRRPAETVAGGAGALVDSARLLFSAEAVGIAGVHRAGRRVRQRASAVRSADRHVPGGQHHCANMLVATRAGHPATCGTRLAPAGTDAFLRRCGRRRHPGDPGLRTCAPSWNIQVHGGIGFTWEHRRPHVPASGLLRSSGSSPPTTPPALTEVHLLRCVRRSVTIGCRRGRGVPGRGPDLRRADQGASPRMSSAPADRLRLRDAALAGAVGSRRRAVEQLVIEQEFSAAGVQKPATASPAG